ncbi:hypothetical protein GALL_53420 [mine drainage metagenome]|uniref:Uncharacterized protein n=1 Tax=mine drainage metagenome TaxID=410659 RepID=A0A1J5TB48_9ZZZZ
MSTDPSNAPSPGITAAAADGFDESRADDGSLRTHWAPLSRLLDPMPGDETTLRRESIRRSLDELGATYNVYADSLGQERPWTLDPIPFPIPPNEWSLIEAGLVQRNRLLNLLVTDIYGEQRVLREGWLPAELVYGSPAFLRPCVGLRPPGARPLVLHAVNLVRRRSGGWCVLSDRTQSPSGLGYALANRIVLSRVLPEEFRLAQVQRLAGFFMDLRESLRTLAPENRESPSIALLTPGPFNETYFEHAFLARYLGFPLVEGADLTERDGRICIRTLDGLRPVDVLLRRVDDAFCDPLELKSDSCLGVAGLLDAVRAGRIALANALGSAWIETPALGPFLPSLCRNFLDEDLLLPDVDSWWCGHEREHAHVRTHLDRLVVKRTFRPARAGHLFGPGLSDSQREAILRDLDFSPIDFTAQDIVTPSRAPVLGASGIEDRSLVLRTFVCATERGPSVLPGGLTRVAGAPDERFISMQEGGASKDTWVISDKPVANLSLLRPATQVVRLERAPSEVPSRVADNLYWLGRYAERLEDSCRILRSVLSRLASESAAEESPEFAALVRLLVGLEVLPREMLGQRSPAPVEKACLELIFSAGRLGAVREVQGRLQTLAFSLRDRFSADTQRVLNLLNSGLRAPHPGSARPLAALRILNDCLLHLAAFSGLEMDNMTRGHAWRFLDMGRRIERAINVSTLLQAGLSARRESGDGALGAILEIADSAMTYRRLYFSQPQWPTVADLLVAEESNPRSFAFQVSALLDHLQRLPAGAGPEGVSRRDARDLGSLRKRLAQLGLADLTEGGSDPGEDDPLPATLGGLAEEMRRLSNVVTQRFFAHSPGPRSA